jgi:hypothetical protein
MSGAYNTSAAEDFVFATMTDGAEICLKQNAAY